MRSFLPLCWMASLAATLLLFAPANAADDTVFLEGIDDVPVMQGLDEDTDAGVVFDKPSGRIVEAVAAGKVPAARVTEFYEQTLPELGWTRLKAKGAGPTFQRDDEQLDLRISRKDGLTVIHFSLTPSPAAPSPK